MIPNLSVKDYHLEKSTGANYLHWMNQLQLRKENTNHLLQLRNTVQRGRPTVPTRHRGKEILQKIVNVRILRDYL